MGLNWDEHLSVGNAMIDAEHKNLIVAVNSVEHAIGMGDRVALTKAFDLLDTYMRIHFRNEEKIAQAVNFSFGKKQDGAQPFAEGDEVYEGTAGNQKRYLVR